MKHSIFMMVLITSMNSNIIFDFTKKSNIINWRIVDDVVMGGRSSSTFNIDNEGFGTFKGNVSLDNNGGFSSVRYRFEKIAIEKNKNIVIKLRGDGKKYQFRIKSNSSDYFSYIYSFKTTNKWQEIVIPLKEMYPAFRGRKLNMSNFSEEYIEEVAFLIGNKKEEIFKLQIDKIELK